VAATADGEGYVGLLPRRFSPLSYEEELLKLWEEIYPKVKEAVREGPKFYFLDGPPYVTNPIHVGTAWNKLVKDAILRYKRMRGFHVRDQPGYDMHGLPIEVMVERKLGLLSKREIEEKLGVARFVEECRSYALENLEVLTRQFKGLGVWMDWAEPYRTIDSYYVEAVWLAVKKAYERGLLERGVKVVHWCPRCGTVLAGYEVTEEYREVESPSIYVKFPLEGRDREYILIWTTTPWTLPANVAVMVNPSFKYVRARAGDEVYILAEARCRHVFREAGVDYEVLEEVPGYELEGLRYVPPLLDEVPMQRGLEGAHRVVLSERYVTLAEGTGCVHVAPGHGEEDFEVGRAYSLPILSPVDDRGVFTKEAGRYAGRGVFEASDEIVADLKSKGLLFMHGKVTHRYPHCWRCKSPLILRSSPQWFIKVTAIKDRLLEESEKVKWVPEWAGKVRFRRWLEEVKDWVISRQRYWGTPLPIWVCKSCSKFIVVSSVEELKGRSIEPLHPALDVHRPWIDEVKLRCECGGVMERVPDVLDVWMDSGAASWACLKYPHRVEGLSTWWPADLVVEGHDQTRGWFYTLLVASIVVFNEAPYRSVLVHGFSLDEQGRAMHKSLGNIVYPEEVIERYGRDALRWYELGCTTWEDLHFSWRGVEEAFKELNVVWNTLYFASLYMNLDRFNPARVEGEVMKTLTIEDRWLLSRTQGLIKQVTSALESLSIHEAVKALSSFILDDVSRWYIKLARKRTWIERSDPVKLAAYYALYQALYTFIRLAAPFIPFLAEKAYQHVFKPTSPSMPASVHLCPWPELNTSLIDERLEHLMEHARALVEASNSIRQAARVKLRRPLSKAVVVYRDPELKECVEELKPILLDLMNVKELEASVEEPEAQEGLARAELRNGALLLDLRVAEDLLDEGLAREVVRRLQEMRKELDLSVDAYVDAYVAPPDEDSLKRLKRMEAYLTREVRVRSLELSMKPSPGEGFYTKRWDIDGASYVMGIRQVS
jgi:isoleucyl-tRNA synthetase